MTTKTRKPRDDISFLINTFGITMVIVALLIAFQPYLENDTRLEEVKQVERSIVSLYPSELPKMLTSKTKKPVMLVAYASWCGFCRQLMPVIAAMDMNHELDGVTPVFVAIEDQPRKLSKYLVHSNYNTIFSPYMVDHALSMQISSAMEPTGSSFNGTIPYVGFFDTDGKIVTESNGVVSRQKLLSMASRVTH